MQVEYTGDAFATLTSIINYIESINTLGAGMRWFDKFESFLTSSLTNPSLVPLCNNQTFNELGLRCLNYNDWIVAFSIEQEATLIHTILHTSRIMN